MIRSRKTGAGEPSLIKTSTILPNQRKIESAVLWINSKVEEVATRGILQVGDYVLREFFNDDPAKAKSYNPRKDVSFRKLSNHPDLLISRSRLQSAVGVAILKREANLPALAGMGISHLTVLLPLSKEPGKLAGLASQARAEGWSCRRLAKAVKQSRIINTNGKDGELHRDIERIQAKLEQYFTDLYSDPPEPAACIEIRDRLTRCVTLINHLLQNLPRDH